MNSVVLQTAAKVLLPVMLVISIIALLRGHNEPGGGFVGGLLAASGFALFGLAYHVDEARRRLLVAPRSLVGAGLMLALLSGLPALFSGAPFMAARWVKVPVPGLESPLKLGTPLVFDLGVYLVVVGITLLIVFALEDTHNGVAPRS